MQTRECHPPSRWYSIVLPNCVLRGRSSTHSEGNFIQSGSESSGDSDASKCALVVGTQGQQKCSGSFRAMRRGKCGNLGNTGNVESVTCRPHYPGDGTNPPLSAFCFTLNRLQGRHLTGATASYKVMRCFREKIFHKNLRIFTGPVRLFLVGTFSAEEAQMVSTLGCKLWMWRHLTCHVRMKSNSLPIFQRFPNLGIIY